jgi:preprotein translocase subunit SecY
VFALGIMPYISAEHPDADRGGRHPHGRQDAEGRGRRKKLTQWTRYITVALAIFQAWGFALFTESLQGAVATPGIRASRCRWCLFLTTAPIFVMWLGEQITERGLGNGASLLIFFSIVERFWPGIFDDVPASSARARSVCSRCSCSGS